MRTIDDEAPVRGAVPEPARRPDDVERPRSPVLLIALLGLLAFAGFSGGWPLLVVIGALVLMVFLHELGHFITAKWAGMKVTEFFIGFGPRIWSFRRGETEYGLKVIPAGAYVRIIGMHNLDEWDPADDDRTYMSKPFWRRLSVAVAGSTMHFLLALVTIFVVLTSFGVPGGKVLASEEDFERLKASAPWVVGRVSDDSAASAIGLEASDRLISVAGHEVSTFDGFAAVVAPLGGQTVPVVYERDGQVVEATTTILEENPTTHERVGFFGIGPSFPDRKLGFTDGVQETFATFGRFTTDTFTGLGRILSPSGIADLGSRVLDPDRSGPAVDGTGGSAASDDNANRPVSIIGIANIGTALVGGGSIGDALMLFAVVNIFIGIFNLVPLLPLDGGHVAIATYEKIRSMITGKRHHVDVVKLLPLTYAVVLVLVFIGLSTIFLDVSSPIDTGG